jgi:uncharacterized protein (DUF2062 family)
MDGPPPKSRRERLAQQVHDRLVAPLRHSPHAPEYAARGVFVGLLVALTPTVGIQMGIVLGIWAAVRRLRPAWDFNLVVALAWTWVTNVVTAPPLYYIYVVTGRILLNRWERIQHYGAFVEHLEQSMPPQAGLLESAWVHGLSLFSKFGVPMFVGCLPWVIFGSWAGYAWSLGLLRRVAAARARRAAES